MEKKQGFFSALKEEVKRGLSPARSRGKSPARRHESPSRSFSIIPRLRKSTKGNNNSVDQFVAEPIIARSGSLRPVGEALAPLMEGPDQELYGEVGEDGRREGWGNWVRGQLGRTPSVAAGNGSGSSSYRRSDLRLLLGVMGAPLAPSRVCSSDPLPHLSIKGTPIETSSAQYILQQYIAASGGLKLLRSIKNTYTNGKVKMVASEFETATRVVKNRGSSRAVESGGFVLWQMAPDMWYVELAVGGSKVHAGSNGRLVWRHTPWLGSHAAKGPVRPLRRSLQGLDPLTTASMFSTARCVGEKKINGEDCFILKLSADPQTLKSRSEGPAEIIRHVLFGYFSQRTGLLIHLEDSHLTRIQSGSGGDAVYWETTINSYLNEYKSVEGIMIAHSGRSVVTLFRFGEVAMSHTKTRMEEAWSIDEVAFNVPGLSVDCFIPPADIRTGGAVGETVELTARGGGRGRSNSKVADSGLEREKVAGLGERKGGGADRILWRVEV